MRVKANKKSSESSQKGQAAVEMALLLPILVLIILAIVELGRVVDAWVVATNAAREGARYAAFGESAGAASSRASTYLRNGLSGRTDVTLPAAGEISVSNAQGSPGSPVSVVVPVRVQIFTPWIGDLGIPNPVTVRGAATMRLQ